MSTLEKLHKLQHKLSQSCSFFNGILNLSEEVFPNIPEEEKELKLLFSRLKTIESYLSESLTLVDEIEFEERYGDRKETTV